MDISIGTQEKKKKVFCKKRKRKALSITEARSLEGVFAPCVVLRGAPAAGVMGSSSSRRRIARALDSFFKVTNETNDRGKKRTRPEFATFP